YFRSAIHHGPGGEGSIGKRSASPPITGWVVKAGLPAWNVGSSTTARGPPQRARPLRGRALAARAGCDDSEHAVGGSDDAPVTGVPSDLVAGLHPAEYRLDRSGAGE